uniref:Polyamine aminopropyltransferase n=1 Tax=Roseihalotalea indica TaxID=2867963 RepID=A0AA49JE19_9BACT|nr:polyamine aminopropyltransferase [Tunicatimonas sp. TK19036]
MSITHSSKGEDSTSRWFNPSKSYILKLSLFATGLAGIVAEYVLSTLATYFLGDSVFQWTMIVSLMLFSMGLGSRLSQFFEKDLLQKFILVEFTLSVLCGFSALFAYVASGFTLYTGLIIYCLCILIGLLIGLEIPLVIRVNDTFEALRINVASVMEKDYFGSLLGGVFFAFVGLPYLGLTYTPFVLAFVNFSVAILLLGILWKHLSGNNRKLLGSIGAGVGALLLSGVVFAKPVILFGEQQRYRDKVIFEQQSRYQKIVITQWKDDYWLYINGNQQLSSVDEVLYHEPLVHPAMTLAPHPTEVLVLGGGDGCAIREILKYPSVTDITLVDLDPAMTKLGKEHPVLLGLNDSSFYSPKVKIHHEDAYTYLEKADTFYDVIIVDLPDPKSVDLNRLYTLEFYRLAYHHLRKNGVLITQAGSPYFATQAFKCIYETMNKADFQTAMLHNQVVTMGEWGWVLGVKTTSDVNVKERLQQLSFKNTPTEWINHEAMQLMTSFGKNIYVSASDSVEINQIHNPVLYQYYLKGNWDWY